MVQQGNPLYMSDPPPKKAIIATVRKVHKSSIHSTTRADTVQIASRLHPRNAALYDCTIEPFNGVEIHMEMDMDWKWMEMGHIL